MTSALAAERYVLGPPLGAGGMAAVYRAHDTELDRPVAVKLLAEHLALDEAYRRRFLREARLAARLAHPNVVAVFDAGETEDGRPYIVMELVEGESVAALLSRGPVEPARAVDLAVQACSGLEHAHAAGLVHRDVKPQNLLLREDGVLKIADFGIARHSQSTHLTELGSVLGTAAYLAPEQAAGVQVTAAADLYSLGVVLYELLAGRAPFAGATLAELAARKAAADTAPLPAEVPGGIVTVVHRALAADPASRPASAAAFAAELAAAAPEPPTVPLPQPAGLTATRVRPVSLGAARYAQTSRGRLLAVALAAAALAGLGAAALAGGGSAGEGERSPERVAPAPTGEGLARNLATWLRENSAEERAP